MRVDELEAEVKALREEIENARKAAKSEEEVHIPLDHRNDLLFLCNWNVSKTKSGGCAAFAAETLHPSGNGSRSNGA